MKQRVSKEHFQKAWMKLGDVRITFSTKKTDIAHDVGFISGLTEAAIGMLNITCCDDNFISNFYEIMVIPAMGADNTHAMFFVALFSAISLSTWFHCDGLHFLSESYT